MVSLFVAGAAQGAVGTGTGSGTVTGSVVALISVSAGSAVNLGLVLQGTTVTDTMNFSVGSSSHEGLTFGSVAAGCSQGTLSPTSPANIAAAANTGSEAVAVGLSYTAGAGAEGAESCTVTLTANYL